MFKTTVVYPGCHFFPANKARCGDGGRTVLRARAEFGLWDLESEKRIT